MDIRRVEEFMKLVEESETKTFPFTGKLKVGVDLGTAYIVLVVLDEENHQGVAVVNYTDRETPYTRVIEHKHFEFGTQPKTVITREYPADWAEDMEPYYPINDEKNQNLYQKYKELADKEDRVLFGGRLAEYKYYDMDKVIESAFKLVKKEFCS